jgi:hypothetical protein
MFSEVPRIAAGSEPCLHLRLAPQPDFRPRTALLAVGLRDLSDKRRPGHVDGAVHGPSLLPRIVLEDFHHQRGVVGEDHAGLQHAQKTDLSFGLAESTRGVDGHVGVKTLANSRDGGERRANFKG